MKKWKLGAGALFFLTVVMATTAKAADSSSGCGVGWMVTQRNSLLSSLIRAYTNATFSSTFGMTSGTSGCANHDIVKNDMKRLYYTEANYEQLMVEMAQGKGDYLQAYAFVLGCGPSSYGDFASTMKKHYAQIFSEGQEASPNQVLNNVVQQIKNHPTLDKECGFNII